MELSKIPDKEQLRVTVGRGRKEEEASKGRRGREVKEKERGTSRTERQRRGCGEEKSWNFNTGARHSTAHHSNDGDDVDHGAEEQEHEQEQEAGHHPCSQRSTHGRTDGRTD